MESSELGANKKWKAQNAKTLVTILPGETIYDGNGTAWIFLGIDMGPSEKRAKAKEGALSVRRADHQHTSRIVPWKLGVVIVRRAADES